MCWTPIQTVLLYKSVTRNLEDWDTNYNMIVLQVRCHDRISKIADFIYLLQICSHVLAYTNSCLNPILYAKMSRNFRCGFSQVGASSINSTHNLFAWAEGFSMTLFAIHLINYWRVRIWESTWPGCNVQGVWVFLLIFPSTGHLITPFWHTIRNNITDWSEIMKNMSYSDFISYCSL